MAYLSDEELHDLGFLRLGRDVKISDKASIYDASRISVGNYSRIDDFCVLSGSIQIGSFVHIAPLCLVAGGEAGIEFDDFSGLAYHVQVFAQSDDYSGRTMTNPTVPDAFKSERKAKVRIGRHVIVGAGAILLPGVHLSEGCAVGAMTLVTESTEPWGLYVGNPAKRLRDRHKDLLELEQSFLESFGRDSL